MGSIYDVMRNTGYMTFGTSHDTAEFACDCLVEQWEKHLRHVYPSAKCSCILCDGGGSNNARSWQFKWCLMETAKRLGIDIRIAHYPPYCSKWNPIEHMLFSQISRVWSGAVFNTIEESSDMAAKITTKMGLAVFFNNHLVYLMSIYKKCPAGYAVLMGSGRDLSKQR